MKKLLAGALALALIAGPALAETSGWMDTDPNNPTVNIPRTVSKAFPLPIQAQGTPAASTNASTTVTTGGTYQTVFASSATRKGCLIQNPTTATEVLNVRVASLAVFTIAAGNTFNCASPSGLVISDLVEVTAATTSHAFTAVSQ